MYNQGQTLIIEAEERSLVSGPATVLLRGLIAPRVLFSVQSLLDSSGFIKRWAGLKTWLKK